MNASLRVAAVICVLGLPLRAELPPVPGTPQNPPGTAQNAQPMVYGQPSNRGVKVFDDGAFKLSTDETAAAPGGEKGVSKGGRYLGDEPDYTTETREAAIKFCEDKKKIGMPVFRACVEKQLEIARLKLKLKMEGGTENVGESNAPPLMDEAPPREPAFRGVDIIEEKNTK